ncbi:MAG: hypothetical protein KatS3mg105_1395 [Gemmatales bacterium]|nr:MAG: hypothetical protein KatS3mg105_1395 [Gemmatales bacterium]
MDATGLSPTPKINRWLPYLAVFEFDVRYTMRSWVYRVWLLVSFLAAIGYLLYRFGVYHEAGIVQPASLLISDLLRWSVLGSIALIAVLAGSAISSERGTMADSVLSRGISRYQYFFGKLHARLVVVVGTFACMSLITLAGGYFLLHEDLSFGGSAIALLTILSLLAAVAICGVSFSAIFNSNDARGRYSVVRSVRHRRAFVFSPRTVPISWPIIEQSTADSSRLL